MLGDDGGEVGPGDDDESGSVGQVVVVGAHGVLYAVLCGAGAGVHGVAAHGVGEGHAGAGFHVAAVPDGDGEPTGHIADGGLLHHVAEQLPLLVAGIGNTGKLSQLGEFQYPSLLVMPGLGSIVTIFQERSICLFSAIIINLAKAFIFASPTSYIEDLVQEVR